MSQVRSQPPCGHSPGHPKGYGNAPQARGRLPHPAHDEARQVCRPFMLSSIQFKPYVLSSKLSFFIRNPHFLTFLLYWRIQVFTGRAASFSELHGGSFITSATPSTISTTGGTTITLMGSNLCRRDISVAIDRSYSTISLVASDKIVLRAPGGLNRQPSLNLSYSLLWYLAPAFC